MAQEVSPSPGRTATLSHPRWLVIATALLSFTGLAISVYMTIAHYNHRVALVCVETGTIDCASVTSSEYSELFGIPLPLLGLAYFIGMAALTNPWAWRSHSPAFRWGRLAGVIGGVLFVVYLVSAELLVLGKICLWCTAVHVITVVLFGLVVADEYRRIGQTT